MCAREMRGQPSERRDSAVHTRSSDRLVFFCEVGDAKMMSENRKDNRIEKGKRGEAFAREYLEEHGLHILKQNWRCKLGELDLIGEQEDEIVFVEVRSRSSARFGTAEESVDQRKQQRLRLVAQMYLSATQQYHRRVRFDVVTVQLHHDGTLARIDHLPGAF